MGKMTMAALAAGAMLLAAPAWAETAKDFNLFTLGDYAAQYTDTEGRVAVGGAMTVLGYGVGDRLNSSSNGTNTVIVGGNINYTNGQVFYGNVVYGGTKTFNATILNGTISQGTPFDFGAEAIRLKDVSSSLSKLAQTGTTTYQFGQVVLNGSSTTKNIFTVSGAQLASANALSITAPTGSEVLLNIDGTVDQMQYFGISLNGGITRDRILYNFYQATGLTIQGISVQGTVLAPNAVVSFNNGNIEGTLIAGSARGQGELHNYRYTGDQLDSAPASAPTAPVPEPASWLTMIAGFGLIGAMLRRRRAGGRAIA